MTPIEELDTRKFEWRDLRAVCEPMTVREYLATLLQTLWIEGANFNSKRPFGNSGWKYDVMAALVKGGFIFGQFDVHGYLEDCDEETGNQIISDLIRRMGQSQTDRTANNL